MGVGRNANGGRTALLALALLLAAGIARRLRSQPHPPAGLTAPRAAPQEVAKTPFFAPPEVTAPPAPVARPRVTTLRPAAPPRRREYGRALALGALVLLFSGTALALALDEDEATVTPTTPTAQVLGTQTSQPRTPAPVVRTTAERALPPRANARTPLRARGFALLGLPAAELPRFVGARVTAKATRVDAVVGDDIFWVGKGSRRLLVHLQGPGTRFAVRRGQRLTFPAVLTRTRPRAAPRWGLTAPEGRRQFDRQGHHLEVYGPNIRFVCVSRCFGYR